jgi:predicted amidohydrolase YtcJ
MYWAEERLGAARISRAYAYKTLLAYAGRIALGTDFPVEEVNPFLTFYAAVARRDLNGYPEGGYQNTEALSREEALRAMTIWAAWSNFEEREKGSIEHGKWADFVILSDDIMQVATDVLPTVSAESVFIGGKEIH